VGVERDREDKENQNELHNEFDLEGMSASLQLPGRIVVDNAAAQAKFLGERKPIRVSDNMSGLVHRFGSVRTTFDVAPAIPIIAPGIQHSVLHRAGPDSQGL
jgi:hypothetical protein